MSRRAVFLLTLLILAGAARIPAEPKAHSTSTSRQFIVYGADVGVRGALCALAEKTKANLLRLLATRDNWKTPLVINLDYPQANLPELPRSRFDFSQIGSGLKLQLNLLVTNDLNGPAVQGELLRVILIEMMYRSRTNVPAGTPYAAPPDWLLDGILQLAPGHDADEAARLLETMVARDKITPVEEIVKERRELLEPAPRRMHDAYALALVQLLVESPNGRRRLLQYIQDLPDAPNDSMADLQAHFPSVLGQTSGKWWNLSVARLSSNARYEILSAAETARQLDRLLHISIPSGGGKEFELSEYESYRKLAGSRAALRQLSRELLLLSARAHPTYHAIVQEYYDLAVLLARGKTRHLQPRFTRVTTYRAVVDSQGRDMDDYLNWFEATQFKTMSGVFSDVLKAASESEKPPRRRDPISVYLDSIEASL